MYRSVEALRWGFTESDIETSLSVSALDRSGRGADYAFKRRNAVRLEVLSPVLFRVLAVARGNNNSTLQLLPA